MLYPFDQAAISLINRVEAAAFGVTIANYGSRSISMLGSFWMYADLCLDWDGEIDHLLGQYEALNTAINKLDGSNDSEHAKIYDALAIAIEFENRLYLACVVVNMIEALEGGSRNIWSTDGPREKIDEEFLKERRDIAEAIDKRLNQ